MEELEATSPEEQTRAAAAECDRLCHVNGNPLTWRAFAVQQQQQQQQRLPDQRGVDVSIYSPFSKLAHPWLLANSFLGLNDRKFLQKCADDSRLPVAQYSGHARILQRAIELGDHESLLQQLKLASAAKDPQDGISALMRRRNAHGETLLHTAVLHQQLGIVQTLLHHGASINAELRDQTSSSSANATLLTESVTPRSENFRFSRLLSAHEATPVHYACAVGNLEILKLLLSFSSKTQPTSSLNKGFTIRRPGSLLLWAITGGHPDVIEYLLLKKRLETDCFDEDGNNSIAIAALVHTDVSLSPLKPILKLLLQGEYIDINHKASFGLTAFDIAEHAHVKQLLAQMGGRTARVVSMEKLLVWDREKSRQEFTYDRSRRAICLRNRSNA